MDGSWRIAIRQICDAVKQILIQQQHDRLLGPSDICSFKRLGWMIGSSVGVDAALIMELVKWRGTSRAAHEWKVECEADRVPS